MTKFEEEVKRPANGPLTELNNNMQEVFSQYRKMRQYADYLEYELKQKDEHILKLENENSFMRDGRTTFDSNGMAVEPKLQHQALPVVPECVAKTVELLKKNPESSWSKLYSSLGEEGVTWLNDFQHKDERFGFGGLNSKLIVLFHLAINGYTVEKPQQKRYEVKLLSGESMYFNPIGNPKNIKDYRFSFGNYAGWKTQFTKSELAEIKDGTFLKRIPGGTPLDELGKDKSYYVWLDDCNYWINPLIELVPVEDGE